MTFDRVAQIDGFLARIGWGAAVRRHLAGDASARRYERLSRGAETAVLMDAPPGCGDDLGDFLRIGAHLAGLGLSPPGIVAADEELGLALIEDLGDAVYTGALLAPGAELPLYTAAADVLLHLQSAPAPVGLPDLSAAEWAGSAGFALEFYAAGSTGERPDGAAFTAALQAALAQHADGPRVLILRDYHAGNLLWLPERAGLARVGLLDFQLGQMGQPGYDLVSLLQDARRDVSPATEAAVLGHFAAARGQSLADFTPGYAVLGALRALRILGIFARLSLLDGKPQYLEHVPRVWGQLWHNLDHPALEELRGVCRDLLPEPTPATLERLKTPNR